MTNANNLRVMVMAGGTGGHVFPALAVADVLRQSGASVEWLGTPKGIENTLVPNAQIPLNHLTVEGVRGKGIVGILKAPFLVLSAIVQAIGILRRFKPNVVIGFGGFASGPGGVAAKLLGIPLVIHEQNAIAGTTNKLLSKVANRVLAAFDNAFSNVAAEKVGNPVRSEIVNLPKPDDRYTQRQQQKEALHLLVLGGSQGAKAINEIVPAAIALIDEAHRPMIRHQAGKSHWESTQKIYTECGVEAEVAAFVDDMAAAYAWADLIICRSGALTVCEISAAGVAALMVPLPNAIDDHQRFNAMSLTQHQAGVMVNQQQLTPSVLADLLLNKLSLANTGDRAELLKMAERARQLAMPNAAQRTADICVEVARG